MANSEYMISIVVIAGIIGALLLIPAFGSDKVFVIENNNGNSTNTECMNVGTGTGFVCIEGTNNLRSILAGAGISVSNNTNTITITNTSLDDTACANIGTYGTGIYSSGECDFKKLLASTGISLSSNATNVIITNSAPDNTVCANVGTGKNVYKDGECNFRSLIASTGLSATENTNDITLTNSGVISNSCGSPLSCSGTNPSSITCSPCVYTTEYQTDDIGANKVFINGTGLPLLRLVGESANTGGLLEFYRYGQNPSLSFFRAQGSQSSPTAVVSTNVIGANQGNGWDGDSFETGANFRFTATETWSNTAHGSNVQLRCVANGSTTVNTCFVIGQDGTATIGANQRLILSESALTSARTKTFLDRTATIADVGKQDLWLPVNLFSATPTFSTTSTTVYARLSYVDGFTTSKYVQYVMPRNYDGGTLKVRVYWSDTASSSTNSVVWSIGCLAMSDTESLNGAYGTAQTLTDSNSGENTLNVSAQTSSITCAGSPTDADMLTFQVSRLGADASDTLTDSVDLHGVSIEYTQDDSVVA